MNYFSNGEFTVLGMKEKLILGFPLSHVHSVLYYVVQYRSTLIHQIKPVYSQTQINMMLAAMETLKNIFQCN